MLYNDRDIINALKQEGTHAKAFEQFYLTERKMITFTRNKYNLREEQRESAYTDAVLELADYIIAGKYEAKAKLRTFLSTIYHRKCIHLVNKKGIKKEKVHQQTAWIDDLPGLSDKSKEIVQELQEEERNVVLAQKMAALKGKCREILTLFYYEGFSLQKIAEKTGYKDGDTIKSKKYRCLKNLLKFFPENWDWKV